MPIRVLFHFNPNRSNREYASSKYVHPITNAYRHNEINNIVDVEHNTISSLPLPKGYLQYNICIMVLYLCIMKHEIMHCSNAYNLSFKFRFGMLLLNCILLFSCCIWTKLLNNGLENQNMDMFIFFQVILEKWVFFVLNLRYWYLLKTYIITEIEDIKRYLTNIVPYL